MALTLELALTQKKLADNTIFLLHSHPAQVTTEYTSYENRVRRHVLGLGKLRGHGRTSVHFPGKGKGLRYRRALVQVSTPNTASRRIMQRAGGERGRRARQNTLSLISESRQ